MKRLFLLLAIAPIVAWSQDSKGPFLAPSYDEFVSPHRNESIRDVFTNATDNKVVVKTATGKQQYPISYVWGFAGKNQVAYRIYQEKPYEIKQADTLSIYERHITMHKARKRQHYFSVGLNGPIHELNSKELRQVFGSNNPEFLSRLKEDLKWHEDYEKFDKKDHSYKIVGVFKKSIHNQ